MNTLDTVFKHQHWFLHSNLTNRQVIEYLASCMDSIGKGDFCFKENKSGTVILGLEDNSTWRPNKEQLEYLYKRIEFYNQ